MTWTCTSTRPASPSDCHRPGTSRSLRGTSSAVSTSWSGRVSSWTPGSAEVTRSALLGDLHLAEEGPVVLRHVHVDDLRRPDEVGRHRLPRGLEVLRLHVGRARLVVAEGLDEGVLV